LKIIIPGGNPGGNGAGEQIFVSFAGTLLRTVPMFFFFLLMMFSCTTTGVLAASCPNISAAAARQKMSTLENTIRHHNQRYYEKAEPEISDIKYDRLFLSLVQLENCFPALAAADSPTGMVGSGLNENVPKVKHERPMVSLSSATGPEAVKVLLKKAAACKDTAFLVQPKVDGLPVELVYVAGWLVSAATRGDGRIGEDVTERVRDIPGIPLQLSGSFPERVVVRGEIYADLSLLKRYSADKTVNKYATPRHAAAGVLQAHKSDPVTVSTLRLFPFELVVPGDASSDRVALQQLSEWGFSIDGTHTRLVRTFAEIRDVYRSYLADREQQPFAMDGIVVKVDDMVIRRRLGEGARAPFWAAAWKYPPDTVRTHVRRIGWTVGRTGRRTPMAEVEPVRLGGVRVSRISLHSAAEMARLDIAPGDQVVVGLVGDVVPQLLEVVGRDSRSRVVAGDAGRTSQPALDACLQDSPECRNQFLAKAAYFTSKSGLAVSGLGRIRLQKLVEAGLVVDLPSLFQVQMEEVAAVSGFTQQAARRLTAAIQASVDQADDFRVVTALGIPGVGPKSVQRVSRRFSSLDALLDADQSVVCALSSEDERAVTTIRRFFHSPGGAELLGKFRELGVLP
jgi:DNA ligase (NAD+)